MPETANTASIEALSQSDVERLLGLEPGKLPEVLTALLKKGRAQEPAKPSVLLPETGADIVKNPGGYLDEVAAMQVEVADVLITLLQDLEERGYRIEIPPGLMAGMTEPVDPLAFLTVYQDAFQRRPHLAAFTDHLAFGYLATLTAGILIAADDDVLGRAKVEGAVSLDHPPLTLAAYTDNALGRFVASFGSDALRAVASARAPVKELLGC